MNYKDILNCSMKMGSVTVCRKCYTTNNDTTSTHSSSRVLKDVFHLIGMTKVPIKHIFCSEFKAKFRKDIFLVLDPDDNANVFRALQELINTIWD